MCFFLWELDCTVWNWQRSKMFSDISIFLASVTAENPGYFRVIFQSWNPGYFGFPGYFLALFRTPTVHKNWQQNNNNNTISQSPTPPSVNHLFLHCSSNNNNNNTISQSPVPSLFKQQQQQQHHQSITHTNHLFFLSSNPQQQTSTLQLIADRLPTLRKVQAGFETWRSLFVWVGCGWLSVQFVVSRVTTLSRNHQPPSCCLRSNGSSENQREASLPNQFGETGSH